MIFTKPAGYRLYIVPGQLMRVMKITFILITTVLLQVTAAAKAQVTLNEKNTPLKKVIKSLKRQSGYDFFYNDSDLRSAKPVTIRIKSVSLEDALAACFKGQDLTYTIEEKTVVIKEKEPPASSRSIPARSSRQQTGRIGGKILDEKGETLPGAAIKIVENGKVVSTAVDGNYVMTTGAGTYTIEVSFVGYTTQRISGVTVREGQLTALDIALKPASARLNEVVITSTYSQASVEGLYARQKNNASMTNGITAEQISVTPDNNTAQVLKRVSGITVQNDKFVTIRGVSDRYNNVLINGASLPSTEPNRRNFSFDIVPSQLVDNIVVNKTASPDLPGEFTGGLVQVNTKDIPTQDFFSFTLGQGFNTASADKPFVSYKRDDKAWLGQVDVNRKYFGDGRLFDPVQYNKDRIENNTAVIRSVGAQIPNRWEFYNYAYQPQKNYQLTGGVNRQFQNKSVGFVAALTYLNEQFTELGQAAVGNQYEFSSERFRYNTSIGGLFNAAFKTPNHRFAWKNLYNKRYSNQLDRRTGNYTGQSYYARRTGEVTLDNRMIHTRLEGEHKITESGIKLDWGADYIQMKRDQPDTRFITAQDYGIPGEKIYVYDFSDFLLIRGGLFNSLLIEKRKNAAANLSLPFKVLGESQLFKVGYSWSERKADFDAANLRILGDNETAYTENMGVVPYHEIVTQDAFAKGYLSYVPTSTRASSLGDKYTGTQTLKAAYAMLDIRPVKNLRITGGVRREENRMTLSTIFYDYATGNPSLSDSIYTDKDWLPSVNLIYGITRKLNIRAAYSKTVARPDFVERSPYVYYDFTDQAEVFGQQNLQISRIKNYDLRLEYYPSGDEILSVSVFYKNFVNPVERFYNIGSTSNTVEYRNLYGATAKGIEFDIRKSLGFIDRGSAWLKKLYVSGNYTYLRGGISYVATKVPGTARDTSYIAKDGRPIQGLSPFIVNWGINYQDKLWGFNVAFNRIGRRIVNGGTIAELIQWENPRSVLDLQLNLRLMKQKLELKTNFGDILNQPFIIYSNTDISQGVNTSPGPNNDPKGTGFNEQLDLINYRTKRGSNISFSATYRF